MTLRLSSGGRPRPRLPGSRSAGNNTFRICHSTPLRSPRLKAASSKSAALNQNEILASIDLVYAAQERPLYCQSGLAYQLRHMRGFFLFILVIGFLWARDIFAFDGRYSQTD